MSSEAFADIAGVRTLVRTRGSGGTPLIMLHGVLSEGASWEEVAGPLAPGRLVVMPDLPLHGGTEAPPTFHPNPRGLVRWLEDLVDHLGARRVDLCGLSLGGAVALHFALARPERVRRLVLVDAANVVEMDEAFRLFINGMRRDLEAAMGPDADPARKGDVGETGFESIRAAAADLSDDPIVMAVLDYLERRGIPFSQAMEGLEFLDVVEPARFAQLEAPTMAIWGAEDPFFPAPGAVDVLRAVPGIRIEVMEGVGHNPARQRPGRFVELVETFLA